MKQRIYQLDPKHKDLLTDHFSGYVWVRDHRRKYQFQGKVVFTLDLAKTLEQSVESRAAKRRAVSWLIKFETAGYIFSRESFVKLLEAQEYSSEGLRQATVIKENLVADLRRESRERAVAARLRTLYGPLYENRHSTHRGSGEHGERRVWLWSFENKHTGKRHEHIFSYVDREVEVVASGTRRRDGSPRTRLLTHSYQTGSISRLEFCARYNLQYSRMSEVAAGKRAAHRGWTLIGSPRLMTHSEAIALWESMSGGSSE